ncbi:MAG: hypothetical protein KF858_16155 [Candidatus Sumerlaeia bacterium]|nr:hypothetical protein [Candidatus Sumerlaeia bacterium]
MNTHWQRRCTRVLLGLCGLVLLMTLLSIGVGVRRGLHDPQIVSMFARVPQAHRLVDARMLQGVLPTGKDGRLRLVVLGTHAVGDPNAHQPITGDFLGNGTTLIYASHSSSTGAVMTLKGEVLRTSNVFPWQPILDYYKAMMAYQPIALPEARRDLLLEFVGPNFVQARRMDNDEVVWQTPLPGVVESSLGRLGILKDATGRVRTIWVQVLETGMVHLLSGDGEWLTACPMRQSALAVPGPFLDDSDDEALLLLTADGDWVCYDADGTLRMHTRTTFPSGALAHAMPARLPDGSTGLYVEMRSAAPVLYRLDGTLVGNVHEVGAVSLASWMPGLTTQVQELPSGQRLTAALSAIRLHDAQGTILDVLGHPNELFQLIGIDRQSGKALVGGFSAQFCVRYIALVEIED